MKQIHAVVNKLDENHEIIVIDDGSADNTAQQAREAGAIVIQHPYNIGNGASVKSGIRHARGQILVTIDGDGQHDPNDIPKLVNRIGPYDMVVGSRNRESDTAAHRDVANMVFNSLASLRFRAQDRRPDLRLSRGQGSHCAPVRLSFAE